MEQLPQQLVNGLWQGAALALFALGYALVFGLLDVVNLAHGATYMWGAFFGLVCVTRFGWPLWVAIPVAMVGAGLLAVVLERLAFKPLRTLTVGSLVLWGGFLVLLLGLVGFREGEVRAALLGLGAALMVAGIVQDYRAVRPLQERQMPYLAPMIASIGASIILVSLAQGIFGAQVSRFPPDLFPNTPLTLGAGVVIAPIQLLVLGVALALMLGLHVLIARTRTGRAIRAIAWSERTARLLGINADLVVAQTFFVSGALAGASGVLLGLAFNRIEPTMGGQIELAGLTVIVVGGMASIGGTVLAAFLVGMLRVLGVAYVDSSFRDALVFGLLILVLVIRPTGLLGEETSERA
jgi:branched-chain amino acid transport system permease protein